MQLDLLSWRPRVAEGDDAGSRVERRGRPVRTVAAPAEVPVSRRLALPGAAMPARGRRPDRKAVRALIAAQAPHRVEP